MNRLKFCNLFQATCEVNTLQGEIESTTTVHKLDNDSYSYGKHCSVVYLVNITRIWEIKQRTYQWYACLCICVHMNDCVSYTAWIVTLQWWHIGHHDGVSNHQPNDCLLSRLFMCILNKNIKAPRHWPLCGEFTGDGWIPRTNGQ